MGSISGRIEDVGPVISVTVMATSHHVDYLRSINQPPPSPVTVRAIIDTGASLSVLDRSVAFSLGLVLAGSVSVHTPSTGSTYELLDQYEASLFFGSVPPDVISYTVGVLVSDLASEGILALIGWDILAKCVLTCDGPAKVFRLDY